MLPLCVPVPQTHSLLAGLILAQLLEVDDEPGYSAAFAPLAYAGRVDVDPFKELASPQAYLAQSVSRLSQQQPGKFGPLIQSSVEPTVQGFLQKYLVAAGVTLH